MKKPLISIIVPVYNVEQYLFLGVERILRQKFLDFELILINDGSCDSSGRICNYFATIDDRVHSFHKSNGGVSSARNLGIEKAGGEWLCFVDSDDFVDDNYLSLFVELLTKYGGDYYVASFNSLINGIVNRTYKLSDAVYSKAEIKDSIIYLRKSMAFGVPWNKMFCTSIVRGHNILFNEDLSSYEDELFSLQYLKYATKVVVSSEVIYNYNHVAGSSLSRTYIEIKKHFFTAKLLYDAGNVISNDPNYLVHVREEYVRHFCESIARLYWQYSDFSKKERIEMIKIILYRVGIENNLAILFMLLRKQFVFAKTPLMMDFNFRVKDAVKKIAGNMLCK